MEPQQQTTNQNESSEIVKKKSTISTPAAIITAGVIIALALVLSGRTGSTNKNSQIKNQVPTPTAPSKEITISPNDYIRGDIKTADVTIVEYSDSDCPYCERFHNTMKELTALSSVKVAWVYRYFPLDIHPNAENEAIALECIGSLGGNDKFWNYLDQIISITVSPEQSKNILTSSATSLGINKKDFETCIANPEVKNKVTEQSNEAQSLGARGTPYSIAIGKNGKQLAIPGAYPIEEVKKIIEQVK
jgi:protein-disulfide isomerase